MLDDANMVNFSPKFYYYIKTAGLLMDMFNIKLADYIPQLTSETELGVDQIISDSYIASGSEFDSAYLQDDTETVEDYYGYE